MLLPNRRASEVYLAACRQLTFANPPALHFPPVELGRSHADRGDLYRGWILSAQYPGSDGSNLPSSLQHRNMRPTHNLLAEEGIGVAEDGRLGDCVQLL